MSSGRFGGPGVWSLLAPNPGPFTLDGTRTYVVGVRRAVILDPGPALDDHLRALAARVAGAESVVILLTHGHADHAAGASRLAEWVQAPILGSGPVDRALADREMVETDAGALVAVSTPGHAREHLCFHWPARAALFSGDLVLGEGDTTWVAGYPGCVADYLQSLETLRSLDLQRIYPTHGGRVDDVDACLDRYTRHRLARVAQVEAMLAESPGATRKDLLGRVYGGALPPDLVLAAQESLDALLDYLGEADRA